MKKTLSLAVAILIFALPMSLMAETPKKDMPKPKALKPLSAMKSTMQSPSRTEITTPAGKPMAGKTEKAADALETNVKEQEESTKSLLEEVEKLGQEKSMDQHK